jgi:hypothetical protein
MFPFDVDKQNDSKQYGVVKTITRKVIDLPNLVLVHCGGTMTLSIPKNKFISIIKILMDGNKIESIKFWRMAFNTSLVDSKEAVEFISEEN